jgi:hypothetical protein
MSTNRYIAPLSAAFLLTIAFAMVAMNLNKPAQVCNVVGDVNEGKRIVVQYLTDKQDGFVDFYRLTDAQIQVSEVRLKPLGLGAEFPGGIGQVIEYKFDTGCGEIVDGHISLVCKGRIGAGFGATGPICRIKR